MKIRDIVEYLVNGHTIVATFTAEYPDHVELLAMNQAGSKSGSHPLFQTALANPNDWNSPERMAARNAVAAHHTYSRHLLRIEHHLQVFHLPALGLSAPI